jgi:hypothetical protein
VAQKSRSRETKSLSLITMPYWPYIVGYTDCTQPFIKLNYKKNVPGAVFIQKLGSFFPWEDLISRSVTSLGLSFFLSVMGVAYLP